MKKKPSPRIKAAADRRAVLAFLNAQLPWIDALCLEYSRMPDMTDLRLIGQKEYYKNYRSAIRHLISIANSRGMKQAKRKPS